MLVSSLCRPSPSGGVHLHGIDSGVRVPRKADRQAACAGGHLREASGRINIGVWEQPCWPIFPPAQASGSLVLHFRLSLEGDTALHFNVCVLVSSEFMLSPVPSHNTSHVLQESGCGKLQSQSLPFFVVDLFINYRYGRKTTVS